MNITQILLFGGCIAVVVAVIYGVRFLKKKELLDAEDLVFAVRALKLTAAVVDSLNLKMEPRLKPIVNIVLEGLKMAATALAEKADKDELMHQARKNVTMLCAQASIPITPSREGTIDALLELTLQEKYPDVPDKDFAELGMVDTFDLQEKKNEQC